MASRSSTPAIASAPPRPSAAKRVLAALGALVVIGAAVAAYLTFTGVPVPWKPAETPTRILLIVATPDDAGETVAQVIALADTNAGTTTAIAPDTKVTIPGTSYNELKDAYPFGGGAAVAERWAQATSADTPAYIVVTAATLAAAVDSQGGIAVDIPAQMDVFDGDALHSFQRGSATLTGEEFEALLKGRPYLTRSQQKTFDKAAADAVATLLGDWPGGLADAAESGDIATDIAPENITAVQAGL